MEVSMAGKGAAVCFCLALGASICVADVREDVRRDAEGQIAEGQIIGAVVAAKDFAPLAVGNRVVDPSPAAMGVETRFDCASVTKTVVAMACARLAAQGKIDVDRPFTDYLTDHVLAKEDCRITVRDLAMHVGGFGGDTGYQRQKDYGEFRRQALALRPSAPRGSYDYQCINMIYVGWIVEKVTGMDLAAAVKRLVLDPLGMRRSGWGPLAADANVAFIPIALTHLGMPEWRAHYNAGLGWPSDPGANLAAPHPIGNAGLFSTAGDLLRFMRDLVECRAFEPRAYDLVETCGYENGDVRRSFGFDMAAGRIPGLSRRAIAHTGWSGQVVVADPGTGFYGVALTARKSMEHGKCRRARERLLALTVPNVKQGEHALVPAPRSFRRTAGCWTCAGRASEAAKEVRRVTDASLGQEEYRLTVAPEGVTLVAATEEGAFRGLTTFRQLGTYMGGTNTWPCCEIADAPAYRWRGYMLDEGRFFFGVATVKKTLDLMAEYKLNVFHRHLTEDQGWRIAVDRYPLLAEYATKRPHSPVYGLNGGSDETPYGPFCYTKDQLRDIVAYAAKRFIKVVPEIEIPGHSRAVLAAYPEFACDPGSVANRVPRCSWGVSDEVMCAGNPAAMKFYEDVLDEVCEIFPSDIVHVGGDECPRKYWKACAKCQARIRAEGLQNEADLQTSVTRHFCAYLAKKGRRMMVWDEALVGGHGEKAKTGLFPKTAIVQGWRGIWPSVIAATNGFDTVVSPWTDAYYSVPQGCRDDPFAYSAWIGSATISLAKAYAWDPAKSIPAAARAHVLGSEACLWTERILNSTQLEYKSWPRGMGFAEALWTAPADRDCYEFKRRAALHRAKLIRAPWRIACAPVE